MASDNPTAVDGLELNETKDGLIVYEMSDPTPDTVLDRMKVLDARVAAQVGGA